MKHFRMDSFKLMILAGGGISKVSPLRMGLLVGGILRNAHCRHSNNGYRNLEKFSGVIPNHQCRSKHNPSLVLGGDSCLLGGLLIKRW